MPDMQLTMKYFSAEVNGNYLLSMGYKSDYAMNIIRDHTDHISTRLLMMNTSEKDKRSLRKRTAEKILDEFSENPIYKEG